MNPMKGRVCLVTGANSGIGLATAAELAKRGASVVMACRDRSRGEAAVKLVRETAGAEPELLLLDLGSLASVRSAAETFKRSHDRLHVLVNNAGVWSSSRRLSADGLELTFAVNHLGHFLLTHLLLDVLQAGAPSRIVNVSSNLHYGASIDFGDLQLEKGYGGQRAYGRSKLANVLFTRELARRLPPGITANAVHPGVIATNLVRDLPWVVRAAWNALTADAVRGAAPSVRLACEGDVEGRSGFYFDKLQEKAPSAAALDDAAARRLWDLSAALAGLDGGSRTS